MKAIVTILAALLLLSVEMSGAEAPSAPRCVNVSARGKVGGGDDILIVGFVVTGAKARVLARAIGPSLTHFGVSTPLADPQLAIFDNKGKLVARGVSVDSMQLVPFEVIMNLALKVGAFPITGAAKDSVLAIDVPAGVYTMHVTSASGGAGVTLGEVYVTETSS